MEYYFKRKSETLVEVAKFDGTKEPTEIYTVRVYRMGAVSCNCLGFVMHHVRCKHLEMVRKWLFCGELLPDSFNQGELEWKINKRKLRTYSGVVV